jgi:hypothetical protein
MVLDTGTMLAIMIALSGSCLMMVLFMRENMQLRKTIKHILEKEDKNG